MAEMFTLQDSRGEVHAARDIPMLAASIAAADAVAREHPVPCQQCGVDPSTNKPRRLTWSLDAICTEHRNT